MSDSEESDLEEGTDIRSKIVYQKHFFNMEPPDVICERWARVRPQVKQRLARVMQVQVFWWPILLRTQDGHPTTAWAVQMGFLDANVSNDLSLKRLAKIEILECVLAAMERGLSHRDAEAKAQEVVSLSHMFCLEEDCLPLAVSWLLDSGEPDVGQKLLELGSTKIRYRTLYFIFCEYARHLKAVACSKKKALMETMPEPDPWTIAKSDEMKNKGNEQFQKKNYDVALKWYTKAIKYYPNNHILYGNRALCLIRAGKYLKALGDGKRAIILQPDWAKGHYRFCDALFYLGEQQKAVCANARALQACVSDAEGQRDLQQQSQRFHSEMQECSEAKAKKTDAKKSCSKTRSHAAGDASAPLRSGVPAEAASAPPSAPESSKSEDLKNQEDASGTPGAGAHTDGRAERLRHGKSEMSPRKNKRAPGVLERPVERSTHTPHRDGPAAQGVSGAVRECFAAAVQEAQAALSDQRCHNAQQAFTTALQILESSGPAELGLSELDRSVLLYGYATALLEIGQTEELGEAEKLFTRLESTDRTFQSLVHYGMGRVYLKENRFAKALERFSNALLMIERCITPGKLTWPSTKALVEETQPAWLKERLEMFLQLCRFPPCADAVCRHQRCVCHSVQIYFSDPDFRGFIQLTCCQSCRVEFHMSCWKKLKTLSFSDKNDKDFLKDSCFTPDCGGQICHIVIFGSTGLIKCEFKSSIPKIRPAGRARLRQQCTSIKKLKSKNDRKLRRKQQRLAARSSHPENNEVKAVAPHRARAPDRASPRDCIYMDCVLLQIHHNKGLFKEESGSISCYLERLRPWMDVFERGGQASVCSRAEVGVLWKLVELLLEARVRVWARVFVEALGSDPLVQPRLQHWAQQLDAAGLRAAEAFVSRYASHLEDLDLEPLLSLAPLQDALVEKFGGVSEIFDRDGFTVMEYLRQAPAKEMRMFIWALESSRERYQSCHAILDQYFEDDAVCLVIKKTDDEEHLSSVFKSKNRHRKKKQKDLKSVIVLSGTRGGHLWDEDEDDELFSDEDTLALLSSDPFSVPEHLRGPLAEFEEQYSGAAQRSHYQQILDNNPDPTRESLYEYFSQVLEAHGPLSAEDPLLVGELQHFPAAARRALEDAGGLEPFLLQSLRFTGTDGCIGLMKHAVNLSHLNPSAKEFWPNPSSTQEDPDAILCSDSDPDPDPDPDPLLWLPDPHQCSAADLEEDEPPQGSVCHTHTGVQVSKECKDVSINTEPYASLERNNGEMMQAQKQEAQLLTELQLIKADLEEERRRRLEETTALQNDTQDITQRMQIAATELSLFQQKLEDEVRKDQQEKKENQETLKNLKVEIKELADLHDSYTRDISVKNKEYQAELERFLDVSNQCAAERLSLEDEIKHFRDACVKAQRRSSSAQVCVLQSRRERVLRRLWMSVSEGKLVVKHLTDASLSFPSAALLSAVEDWKTHVCVTEDAVSRTEMAFDAQIEEVRGGTRLCSLPDISVPSVPAAPPLPVIPAPVPPPPPHFHAPPAQTPAHTAPPAERRAEEPAEDRRRGPAPHPSAYERILERLGMMFPHYSRLVLSKFVQEVRVSSGGALTMLTYDDVINRVAQLILDHQENTREHMSVTPGDTRAPSDSAGTPPLTHVWKNVSEKHRNAALVLNMEDPCIICHEDMIPEEMCVLECRHSFHRECIKSWLKEQSTCPTCREHALLPEDFPLLPGRQRKGHTHTAASS